VVTDYTAILNNRAWYAGPSVQAVFVTYSFSTAATRSVQQCDPGAVGSFQPLSVHPGTS